MNIFGRRAELTADANDAGVGEIVSFVREHLGRNGIKGKELYREVLAVEEVTISLAKYTAAGESITVRVATFMGRVNIELMSKGDRYNPTDSMTEELPSDAETAEAEFDMIRRAILKSLADRIKYRYFRGTHRIYITGNMRKKTLLSVTLGTMALAIVIGLILTMAGSAQFNDILDDYILIPIRTMYLNALKMVVAPLVFFSIATCIARFSDMSELGRIGGRILFMYMVTTFIAVMTGIGAFYLFKPGSPIPTEAVLESAKELTSKTMDVSIKDMIVNIVPNDFVQPFVESNMIQLIFLAVLCGAGTGMIGRYSDSVRNGFEALNALFSKIMLLIINCMPVAIFASFCSMMLNMGVATIVSLLGIFATFLFALFCMMIIYCLLMLILARLNPIPFLKKYSSTMIQVFSLASSNAAIPLNLNACKGLGIASKLYSLSIPLGATLNMDGGCIYMAVFAFALAKTYGVDISAASVTALVMSIIILSVGAPGIPGSGLICLSVLLIQLGVPAEAVGLVMGIDSLVGMFRCMNNCTGDVAVSTIVAKWEGLLDMDRYRRTDA
ncbi:MAG: cation:dicarboxylase symporter family transporter [Lachnospiraceae bacterium]|nr:cation:dicarboxylase symporter family transporter [Lachnospiraceae bacterium]